MSVFGDWGAALADPFKATWNSVVQVFTDPGKATLKDAVNVALPGIGGQITTDLSHPSYAVYQAATLAALAGGDYLIGPNLVSAEVAKGLAYVPGNAGAAAAAADPGAATLLNSPLAATAAAQDPVAMALAGLPTAAGQGGTLVDSPLASNVGGGGLWGLVSGAASKVASKVAGFVKGTAEVSLAAKAAVSPWEKAVSGVKAALGLGGGVNVSRPVYSGGASVPGGGSKAAGAAASALSPVYIVAGLAAGGALLLMMKKTHHKGARA